MSGAETYRGRTARTNTGRASGIIIAVTVLSLAGAVITSCRSSHDDVLRVAVASNFAEPMVEIASIFEERTGKRVNLSFGSTGKHYAQIRNGAPFDLFFAADVRRPALLDEERLALPDSRFTYAIGKLVLWSPDSGYVDQNGKVLLNGGFRFLAIANPELAPYGRAAEEVMRRMGVWDRLARRIVRGENVSQSFQFVKSGSAELGFVAYSQIGGSRRSANGSTWVVPDSLYAPIEQQAVLLRGGESARAFIAFVKSPQARTIIHEFGYETP